MQNPFNFSGPFANETRGKIRESHFKRDQFGVNRVLADGTLSILLNGDGSPVRFPTMLDATREAKRRMLLEGFQQFAAGSIDYRATVLATNEAIARKPLLTYGCR